MINLTIEHDTMLIGVTNYNIDLENGSMIHVFYYDGTVSDTKEFFDVALFDEQGNVIKSLEGLNRSQFRETTNSLIKKQKTC